ncbi:hypothetical protein [Chitinophaga caseinilytica]|uniref:Uncharacterized protein n=1 Tax=Chitinophaga caseinilytica TaxID=2267521 RepID=A0ABZ2Z383_9BACT
MAFHEQADFAGGEPFGVADGLNEAGFLVFGKEFFFLKGNSFIGKRMLGIL